MIEMDTNIPSRRNTNKYIQSTDGNSFYTGRAETYDANNMDTRISVADVTNKSIYNSGGTTYNNRMSVSTRDMPMPTSIMIMSPEDHQRAIEQNLKMTRSREDSQPYANSPQLYETGDFV